MDRLHRIGRSVAIGMVMAAALCLAPSFWESASLADSSHLSKLEVGLPSIVQQLPADVEISIDTVIASGFDSPVQVTHAGDGTGRLFVVEQPGRILVIAGGSVLPVPFLDIRGRVVYGGERGLLGLAFHPAYEDNGQFYINYTRSEDGATVIERYTVSAGDPNLADVTSGTVLLTVAQPYTNHNGGQVLFGPDSYLYIGMGDGGSGGDPLDNGQDPTTLLGAMLRLNVDGGVPYAIPPSNPYVGGPGLDEIWAIGLRNPWRFSFDRLTGDLYIGDVGQNLWEEIDYQAFGTPGGVNFGWRCKEGSHDYNFTGDCTTADLTDPIAEYSHDVGRSVTGGFVYRGPGYPALHGRYFYADYVLGQIWSLYKTGSNPDTWSAPQLELETGLNISAFGEDEAGELYVVDRTGGTIRQLVDANAPVLDLSSSRKRAAVLGADPGETVTYTIEIINTGAPLGEAARLTDTVPAGLTYRPDSLQASEGTWDDSGAPSLVWQGALNASRRITVTYQVTVTGAVTGSIVNVAQLDSPSIAALDLPAALWVPSPVLTTTMRDFFLPGTQPGGLDVTMSPSVDCDICHSAPIYDRWRGSMMSQAGRDPLLWAALATANADAPGAGDYCLRCHTSRGWLEGRSHPPDGSALSSADLDNGVACHLCHRLVDPVPSTGDEAVAIDLAIREALIAPVPIDYAGSATLIADPDDNRRGPFAFDPPLAYHSAYRTDFLGQDSEAVTRARLCGTCHNVDNPVLSWDEGQGQFLPNGNDAAAPALGGNQLFPIETTFDEWLFSDYAQGGIYAPQFAGAKPDGIVEACQDCHLPRSTGAAVDAAFGPVPRDCQTTGCLPEHTMVGGNTWIPQLLQDPRWRLAAEGDTAYLDLAHDAAGQMVRRAAKLDVTLATEGTARVATVRVTNQTGHKLPTGYPEGRQMWLNLRAYNAAGGLIYESGAYDMGTAQLLRDADIKVYEAKQGITPELAAILNKPAGPSFHFVLNNTVLKDNRIPPRGYQQTAYDRPGLRPVGATYADGQYWDDTTYALPAEAERVLATLYYQTASQEYISFLAANGGVDGQSLAQLWQGLKSPPQVMTVAWDPSYDRYLPLIYR